jgi:hypothetical protein
MQTQYVSLFWVKGGAIILCQQPKRPVSHRIGLDMNIHKSLRREARFKDVRLELNITSPSF